MKKKKTTHRWMPGDLVCINQTYKLPEVVGHKWAEECSIGIVKSHDQRNPKVEFMTITGYIDSFWLNDSSLTMISEQEFEQELINNN